MKAKISVSGGKGGTGKSTVAVNLALVIAAERDTVLADLDAEAPNDYILLDVQLSEEKPVEIMVPRIKYGDCIKCSACAKVCDTGALIIGRDGYPFLLPRLCSGCRACYYVCPTDAIEEAKRIIGYTYVNRVESWNSPITLVTGVLREGEEHTPPVVIAARERAEKIARDVLLVDTAAGTGSHVAAAISGSNLLIGVTEPTPLGSHDLELILSLGEQMGIETWVVINRSNIGPEKYVERVLKNHKAKVVARIPYSHELISTYIERKPIVAAIPNSPVTGIIKDLGKRILEVI